jgi:hypothetical protein
LKVENPTAIRSRNNTRIKFYRNSSCSFGLVHGGVRLPKDIINADIMIVKQSHTDAGRAIVTPLWYQKIAQTLDCRPNKCHLDFSAILANLAN